MASVHVAQPVSRLNPSQVCVLLQVHACICICVYSASTCVNMCVYRLGDFLSTTSKKCPRECLVCYVFPFSMVPQMFSEVEV